MGRVIHFEIHVANPQRAIQFYTNCFGWSFKKYGDFPYWLITTGPKDQPGIDGGLMPRRGEIDGEAIIAYVCTIDVPSVDDSAAVVEKNGGTIVVPKAAIGGVGWLIYAKDTEGNIFGIMQADPNAS